MRSEELEPLALDLSVRVPTVGRNPDDPVAKDGGTFDVGLVVPVKVRQGNPVEAVAPLEAVDRQKGLLVVPDDDVVDVQCNGGRGITDAVEGHHIGGRCACSTETCADKTRHEAGR